MHKVQKLHTSISYKAVFCPVTQKPSNRHLTHEEAAAEIARAGKAQSATHDSAVAFLKSIGVVSCDGQLTERYR